MKRKWGTPLFCILKDILAIRDVKCAMLTVILWGMVGLFFFLPLLREPHRIFTTARATSLEMWDPKIPSALSSPLHTSLETHTVVLTRPDSLTYLKQNKPLTPLQVKKLWLVSKANLLEQVFSVPQQFWLLFRNYYFFLFWCSLV